jgi:hypothetical protein
MKKESLFSYLTHILGIVFLVTGMLYFAKVYSPLTPAELDTYPNYLLVFAQDLVVGPCCINLVIFLKLRKNEKLRREVWHEFTGLLDCFFEN